MEELLLHVRGFKSIVGAEVRLERVTVLLGPPAAGKSNLLEAIMLLGYAARDGPERVAGLNPGMGPLSRYLRLSRCRDMLSSTPRLMAEEALVALRAGRNRAEVRTRCSEAGDKALIRLSINGSEVYEAERAATPRGEEAPGSELLQVLAKTGGRELAGLAAFMAFLAALAGEKKGAEEPKRAAKASWVPSARLYSFDRFNVWLRVAAGLTGSTRPPYLSEDASNIGWLLYSEEKLLREVNAVIDAVSSLELRPLSSGALAFFDGLRDVGAATVSDTLLRLVYLLTALYTAEPLKIDGTELEPLVMLEDPEAHIYPAAYPYLVEAVNTAASRGAWVVVTTHSGVLAEQLWEKTAARIYYVNRDEEGTSLYEVDMEEVISNGMNLDELIGIHSSTLVQKLAEKRIIRPTGSKATA